MDTKDETLYICPKCGEITWKRFIYDNKCSICDLEFEKIIKTNYNGDIYNQMDDEQTIQWEQKLRERYVLCSDNPYYDKESYYKREDEDFKSDLDFERAMQNSKERQQSQQTSTQTVCPKCGSTSFTPVRRKWSFLTGFMTNKVDMVCNNCGCTVKRG